MRFNAVPRIPYFIITLYLFLLFQNSLQAATGERSMVVTSDARATQAALEVLEKGGNAVDALVAAQMVLNVVEPQASGIGGAGFLLFYDAGTRSVRYFDGSVKAPAKAYPGMFLGADGEPLPFEKLRSSGLATGAPGTFKLLSEVHARYRSGKFRFPQLLDPAVELAEKGTEVSDALAEALQNETSKLGVYPEIRQIFFRNGSPLKEGQQLFQQDFANALRIIQKEGEEVFYRGGVAKKVLKTVQTASNKRALLEGSDLENYKISPQDPLHGSYRGYDLFTASPPSAGGVTLLAGCNLLSQFELSGFLGKPEAVHLVAEATKMTGSVSQGIGDPAIFELPVADILSGAWTEKQAAKIQYEKARRVVSSGEKDPERWKPRPSSTILIVDKSGSIVAYTGTLGDTFGSALMVPGLGFFLNDLLLDFNTDPASVKDPDAPNIPGAFQRPRNFTSPVIAFENGKPVFVFDAGDGGEASAVTLNMVVQRIDFKVPCGDLTKVSRLFDRNGTLQMEKSLFDQLLLRVQLELWGHRIKTHDTLGEAQVVCFEGDSGRIVGMEDPRGDGEAAGF